MTLQEFLDQYDGDEELAYEELGNQIQERLAKKTARKTIHMEFTEEEVDVTGSKLCGVPFIPENGAYPVNTETGAPLFFLFQVNFAEMPPMEKYPSTGILQLFIGFDDYSFGADPEDPTSQKNWRMLYHEDISSPLPKEKVKAMMPDVKNMVEYVSDVLPLEDPDVEYGITFTEETMPLTLSDYRFHSVFTELCADIVPDEIKEMEWYDYPEPLFDFLEENMSFNGHRIGGYPRFEQEDPRAYGESGLEGKELLLQLDSDEDALMWADGGVANFFISEEDLLRKDFTNVFYAWDCG